MPRAVRIIDRDRGFKRLVKRIRRGANPPPVKVGVLSGSGGEASGEGGLSVLDVASIHEFGLNGTERSFIRAWADADRAELEDAEKRLAESVIKGRDTVESALEKMGVLFAAKAQKYIQDGRVTPATVKSDGDGNTTLIDKGQLVGSISHEVG